MSLQLLDIPPHSGNLHSADHLPPCCVSTLLEQILNWAKGTSRSALASNFFPILRSPVWHSHIHRANDSLPATQLYNNPGGIEISPPPWSLELLCGTEDQVCLRRQQAKMTDHRELWIMSVIRKDWTTFLWNTAQDTTTAVYRRKWDYFIWI